MEPEPNSFRQFVMEMSLLVENAGGESEIIDRGKKLLKTFVSDNSWLSDIFIQHNSKSYSQNLWYLDPQQRFSTICFVWGPGQQTPIHNHTVWDLLGIIKGEERCDEFEVADGIPVYTGRSHKMIKGQVDAVSPTIGDWHRVSNPTNDVSISIHVYGANIGKVVRRKVGVNQNVEDFVSGYSSECVFRS